MQLVIKFKVRLFLINDLLETYRCKHGVAGVVREQIAYLLDAALKRSFLVQILDDRLQLSHYVLYYIPRTTRTGLVLCIFVDVGRLVQQLSPGRRGHLSVGAALTVVRKEKLSRN